MIVADVVNKVFKFIEDAGFILTDEYKQYFNVTDIEDLKKLKKTFKYINDLNRIFEKEISRFT